MAHNMYVSGPNPPNTDVEILTENLLQQQFNSQLLTHYDVGDPNVLPDMVILPLTTPPMASSLGSISSNTAPPNLGPPSSNPSNVASSLAFHKFISVYVQLSPRSQDAITAAITPLPLVARPNLATLLKKLIYNITDELPAFTDSNEHQLNTHPLIIELTDDHLYLPLILLTMDATKRLYNES
ncbi:hypothetical protein BDN67DRAFT_1014044 [Paxillus ammoniavirescens]|nr:hypothetical protein BDN67DRAFT_1014044 [Paxillus ammoniavirescens]